VHNVWQGACGQFSMCFFTSKFSDTFRRIFDYHVMKSSPTHVTRLLMNNCSNKKRCVCPPHL
jgi:hypothetical protein